MDSKKCKRLIAIMEQAYSALRNKPSRAEAQRWIQFGNDNIKLLKKILVKSLKTIGEKIRIQTTIAVLMSLTTKFKKSGSGVASTKLQWVDLETAFKGRIRTGMVINLQHRDLSEFVDDSKRLIIARLKRMMNGSKKKRARRSLKVNVILTCKFKITRNDEIVEENKIFNTRNEMILRSTNIEQWFSEHVKEKLLSKVEQFEQKESGWSLVEIINLQFNMNKYTPLRGGLSTFVGVPKDLQVKRAVVNIINNDSYCFLYAVTAALSPAVQRNGDRINSYRDFREVLAYKDFSYPMKVKSIPRFERVNKLCINVYGVERRKGKSDIVPIYLSRERSERETIHLLMLETEVKLDDNSPVHHFAWIKNLSRLVSSQISNHNHVTWLCDRCLSHFQTEDRLNEHKTDCFNVNGCKIVLPKDEEKILKFKNFKYKEDVPFAIYADLECLLEPDQSSPDNQKHVPHSIAYYVHCTYSAAISQYKSYRGKDCIEWFMRELRALANFFTPLVRYVTPMKKLTTIQKHAV